MDAASFAFWPLPSCLLGARRDVTFGRDGGAVEDTRRYSRCLVTVRGRSEGGVGEVKNGPFLGKYLF